MEDFQKQGGISFLLVNCKDADECYFLPLKVLKEYWNNAQKGGRKSIPYTAFEKKYRVYNKNGFPVHYLEAINTFLLEE